MDIRVVKSDHFEVAAEEGVISDVESCNGGESERDY